MAVSLLLADDHRIVRQGVWALLAKVPDFHLVGEAADGLEALRLTERLRPEVLVLDLMLPGLNGLEVARQLGRRAPRTRVVVLSMHDNEAYMAEAVRAGVSAYVIKDAGSDELVRAIRAAAAGERFYRSTLPGPVVSCRSTAARDAFELLTARERMVFQLTAEGHSSAEIAGRLHISPRTVESHRANLMRKLGLRNQRELVRYAWGRGVLPSQPPVPPIDGSPREPIEQIP
jgi:DNA-binding NarL/FixJ family response regulator